MLTCCPRIIDIVLQITTMLFKYPLPLDENLTYPTPMVISDKSNICETQYTCIIRPQNMCVSDHMGLQNCFCLQYFCIVLRVRFLKNKNKSFLQ